MNTYDLNKIDKDELQALGLIDEKGELKISDEDKELLAQGLMTEDISLRNIQLQGRVCDLDCKMSLYQDSENNLKLLLHPYYKDLEQSKVLSTEEMQYVAEKAGTHTKHDIVSGVLLETGKAPYKDDPNQKESFYVKLDTATGEKKIWGVNLKPAIQKANAKIGDNITIKNTGVEAVKVDARIIKDGKVIGTEKKVVNRNNFDIELYDKTKDVRNKILLVEYDEKRKAFNVVDANKIPIIEAVNGHKLTQEQKQKLKEGEEIKLDDDIKLQVSPNNVNLFNSNKKLLVLSMMLDGGLSFMLIKAFEKFQEYKRMETVKKEEVNKLYLQQVDKLRKDVSNIIAKNGSSTELKELSAFLGKEYEKAEADLAYKNPQTIVASEDKAQETESQLENKLDEESQSQEQEREESQSQEQEREESQSQEQEREESQSQEQEREEEQSQEQTRSYGRKR